MESDVLVVDDSAAIRKILQRGVTADWHGDSHYP